MPEYSDEKIIAAFERLERRGSYLYDQKIEIDQELRNLEREIIRFSEKYNDVLEGNVEGYIYVGDH
jgi:hypothetical protein